MRGPKPKPSAIALLDGNPGRRPVNELEPKPEVGAEPPAHLSGEAAVKWAELAPQLENLGILSQIDADLLAMYCQFYGRWVEAEQHLAEESLVLTGGQGGVYQNPWLAVANKAMEQMHKLGAEFGLTPSSRTRIKVDDSSAGKAKASLLAEFARLK